MKQASKFMPNYKPRKVNILALVSFISLFLTMVFYQPIILLVFSAMIAILAIIWRYIERPKTENILKICALNAMGFQSVTFEAKMSLVPNQNNPSKYLQ